MTRPVLVRGARQLLTLHGPNTPRRGEALRELGIIPDGSVLIVNGEIVSVGPSRRVDNLAEARDAEVIDAAGCVVMPGFVDCHTHLITGPPRLFHYAFSGHAAAAPQMIESLAQYVRNTAPATLEHIANRYLEACLRHGTTTIEAKSGFGLPQASEWKLLKVLGSLRGRCPRVVPTFMGAHAVPADFGGDADAFMESVCSSLLPRIREKRLANFVDILASREAFPIHLVRQYAKRARELRLGLKLHCAMSNPGAEELAAGLEYGATSIDGLNCVTPSGIELLARSDAVAVALPGPAHRGTYPHFPPARQMMDAGVAVALGSGFHPSLNTTFNMQAVVSLACTHMGMRPDEAISAATVNAAHAVGLGEVCGTLQFGKQADLIMLNVPDYREIPYYFGANMVAMTMCGGFIAYREGKASCLAS